MGNRSSSSPYSPHTLSYGKRSPPAAYIEPYVDFPPRNAFSHPPPQVFMDRRLGGSRLSLNAVPVDTPIIIPDLKTLKKLEKMDKKQRKIMKKLGLTPMPVPPHFMPPPPRYTSPPRLYNSRTLSVDDLQRAELDRAESRLREQWRRHHPQKSTVSSVGTSRGRSSISSSPVTSSSEAPTVDRIINTGSKGTHFDGSRTIEVRVQRKEESETTNYALPIVRGQYGSKSSLGTTHLRTDQSEIDFSWVKEEEEKLLNAKRKDSLPECYFGAHGSELRQRDTICEMGNSLDRLGGFSSQDSESSNDGPGPSSAVSRKRKLKRDSPDNSPIKVTKLDTAKYVYEKLYLQGEGSDIRITALDYTWNLHKIYLRQCTYFEVLLDGEWEDSKKTHFEMEFPDKNITKDGLHAVFGSLYNDEIEYTIENLLSIIATASFFKHEDVLTKFDEELSDFITPENVVRFNNMAKMYGLKTLRKECMQHLKNNFWHLMKNFTLLGELEQDDLHELLSSMDLLIIDGELDLYRMVKNWIYLKHNSEHTGIDEEALNEHVRKFLQGQEDNYLFYSNAELFASLRLHHLLTSLGSIAELETDNLIPKDILRVLMVDQWKTLLSNEENPKSISEISDENFYLSCLRGGRVVEALPKTWRWVGFNNCVDVVVHYSRCLITLKRNCFHTATPYSVNLKTDRVIHYRLVVCDSDCKKIFDSGKKELTLQHDQSALVCRLPDCTVFPASIHLFYLSTTPPPPSFLYVNQYLRSQTVV